MCQNKRVVTFHHLLFFLYLQAPSATRFVLVTLGGVAQGHFSRVGACCSTSGARDGNNILQHIWCFSTTRLRPSRRDQAGGLKLIIAVNLCCLSWSTSVSTSSLVDKTPLKCFSSVSFMSPFMNTPITPRRCKNTQTGIPFDDLYNNMAPEQINQLQWSTVYCQIFNSVFYTSA